MTTVSELLADLVASEPALQPVLDEHERDNGELLPHVLFGDITRWVVEHPANPRLLGVLERHLGDGDAYVRDLLLASFVENLLDEPIDHLRDSLGPRLSAALMEWDNWHPDAPT
jgi:hypothetical protein